MRRLVAAFLLEHRSPWFRRSYFAEAFTSRTGRGNRAFAQGDHQRASSWWSAAPRHGGLEAGRPLGHSRRVQADRNQRAGHPNLRTHATHGQDDGQIRHHSLDGRFPRRTRPLPVPDGIAAQCARNGWRHPLDGSMGVSPVRQRRQRHTRTPHLDASHGSQAMG